MTTKSAQCGIGLIECLYLRHIMGRGQVEPKEKKLQAIKAFATPRTKKYALSCGELVNTVDCLYDHCTSH